MISLTTPSTLFSSVGPPLPHCSTLQEDLERVRVAGHGRVDITVGSALDIFGGKLAYKDVVDWHKAQQKGAAAR